MNSVVVHTESLADISVRYFFSIVYWPEIATLNNLPMTAVVPAGQVILLPETPIEQEGKEAQNNRKKVVKTAIVKPGQTWADLAVQHLGGLEGWAELVILNGGLMTEWPAPGTAIKLPDIVQRRAQRYMYEGKYKPSTGAIPQSLFGIDYMGIEFDFTVN
jgi:LysM domain